MSLTIKQKKNEIILNKYGQNFCAAPFTSLYEGEKGTITTCCKSRHEIGNTKTHTYEEVVNSEHMKQTRLQLLNGEKPKQCINCFEHEEKTKSISIVRETENAIAYNSGNLDTIINEMESDGTIKNQMPAWLDLLSTNKCNFSCLGCKPHLSSTIAKKYNAEFQILHDAENNDYKNWTEEWTNENQPRIDYILKYGHTLDQIHLNGGEPFLSAETYELLDAMIEAGLNKTVKLWSHTNGSILKNYKGKDLITDYFAKWKRARITMSNDGIGIVGEYIRYGYTDEKWKEVFLKISKYSHIDLQVNSCLNIFNVFHLRKWNEDLLELAKEAGKTGTSWNALKIWDDKTVNICMLGICNDTKEHAVAYLDTILNDYQSGQIKLNNIWAEKISIYKKLIENSNMPKPEYISAFVCGVEALDLRRKIKFKDACPELIPLFEKAKRLI